jgi:hypothetical protein
MDVITTQENVSPKTSASKNGGAQLLPKSPMPLEVRTDLTISEVEALGLSDSYELIDGRIIFKMATSDHSYIQLKLAAAFDAYLEAHPIGMAFTELSVRIFRMTTEIFARLIWRSASTTIFPSKAKSRQPRRIWPLKLFHRLLPFPMCWKKPISISAKAVKSSGLSFPPRLACWF